MASNVASVLFVIKILYNQIWSFTFEWKLFVILGTKGLVTVGEMYFDKDKMKINMDNVGRVGKDGSKKLLGYVWIYLKSHVNTAIEFLFI